MVKISMSNRFQFRMMPEFRGLLWPRKGGDIHYIGGAEIPTLLQIVTECTPSLEHWKPL